MSAGVLRLAALLAGLGAALGGCAPAPQGRAYALPSARLGDLRVVPCPAAVPAAARATSCPPGR